MNGHAVPLRRTLETIAEQFRELEDLATTQDVEAVLKACDALLSLSHPPVMLTRARWTAVVQSITQDLPRREQAGNRWRRERLALATLLTLADRGQVQLIDSIYLSGVPRRRILDPLDPDLRLLSDHQRWQRTLVQRLGGATQLPELAWEAAAALLLFGGPCGEEAWRWIWSLRRNDHGTTSGLMRFRDDRTEQTVLLWYTHPVQQLALARLLRMRSSRSATVFPPDLRRQESAFLQWLQAVIGPAAPGSLRQVTLTTARWMLEVYPPVLVALASGRFPAPAADDARRPRASRPVKPFPPSADERQLRQDCRKTFLRWLERRFSDDARAAFLQAWKQLRVERVTPDRWPPADRVRWDHLDRLMEMVAESVNKSDRVKTLLQLWDGGCTLIDLLGAQPITRLDDAQFRVLCRGYAPTTQKTLRVRFTQLRNVDASPSDIASTAPRSSTPARGRPPRYIPDLDAYERIRAAARDGRRYTRATLQLYIDLLALGLRKEETVHVRLGEVDPEGNGELLVAGTKTPAAHRRLGLWRHPNRAAVDRLLAVVRARRGTDPATQSLLLDRNGQAFLRFKHPDREPEAVIDGLDHGVVSASQRVGLPDIVVPHALRHASVSLYIGSGRSLEWASQAHGHVELLTTLTYYVHSAADRQRDLLEARLASGWDVWFPLALAPRLLGVSKQAVYRRARRAPHSVQTAALLASETLRQAAQQRGRYVSARWLVQILRSRR